MKKFDVFPALIYLAPPDTVSNMSEFNNGLTERPQGTRRVDRARAALFNNKLIIYVDSPEGPKLVFREDVLDYERSADHKKYYVRTVSDKVASIEKDVNCGCGSRLRSISMFNTISNSTEDPDA